MCVGWVGACVCGMGLVYVCVWGAFECAWGGRKGEGGEALCVWGGRVCWGGKGGRGGMCGGGRRPCVCVGGGGGQHPAACRSRSRKVTHPSLA